MHAAAAASDNGHWQPTLAIACCPLDAGQTDVMIDRHDRPITDFKDTERPPRAPIVYLILYLICLTVNDQNIGLHSSFITPAGSTDKNIKTLKH